MVATSRATGCPASYQTSEAERTLRMVRRPRRGSTKGAHALASSNEATDPSRESTKMLLYGAMVLR
jgi:hypothetical protein